MYASIYPDLRGPAEDTTVIVTYILYESRNKEYAMVCIVFADLYADADADADPHSLSHKTVPVLLSI